MNDNTDALDELVSRYLDAKVTADEAARVESDPELLARADAMRAAIEAIAASVDIPIIDLDERRTIALDASSTSTGITDLSSARTGRIEQRNRFVAVAAAVVLLAVAFTVIKRVDLDDDDQGYFATESTDSAVGSDAAADAALEMFADDRATEETAADIAESAAAEMGDWADDEFDNGIAPEHGGRDAATTKEASVDVLPDELTPVETVSEVVGVVDKAYDDVMGIRHRSDPFDGICREAIQLITEFQGDTTVSVESTMVQIGAEDFTVLVALDAFTDAETASRIILVHPVDDCAASLVVSPKSP
jgi:hypothetical protein